MEYDYVHYNHIGAFRCTKCGHHKPATDYTATALDLGRGTLTIDSSITIQLAFRSIYNVYNILRPMPPAGSAAWRRTPPPGSSTTTS